MLTIKILVSMRKAGQQLACSLVAEHVSGLHTAWGSLPTPHKPEVVVHTHNSSTWKFEAEGQEFRVLFSYLCCEVYARSAWNR